MILPLSTTVSVANKKFSLAKTFRKVFACENFSHILFSLAKIKCAASKKCVSLAKPFFASAKFCHKIKNRLRFLILGKILFLRRVIKYFWSELASGKNIL